jgi:hypothetical protein
MVPLHQVMAVTWELRKNLTISRIMITMLEVISSGERLIRPRMAGFQLRRVTESETG